MLVLYFNSVFLDGSTFIDAWFVQILIGLSSTYIGKEELILSVALGTNDQVHLVAMTPLPRRSVCSTTCMPDLL